MDLPLSCSEGHITSSPQTAPSAPEGSWVVQGAPSHTRGPLGSLEGPDKRLAIRGPLHALRKPFTDSKVRGPPVTQGAPATRPEGPATRPEGPCHVPRGPLLQRAPSTRPESTGYLRDPFGSDRSEGPSQVLKGTLLR